MIRTMAAAFSILLFIFSSLGENSKEREYLSCPWKIKIVRPTLEEYIETMDYWSEKYPQAFSFEKLGENTEKQPIFLAKLSDRTIPDSNKYVILVTALHSGAERSGAAGCLNLMEWLLGGSEEAKQTLRNHIVYVMPIVNPYAFFTKERMGNSIGVDPYSAGRGKEWDVKELKLINPSRTPEIDAFMKAVDLSQPEVHVDIHGVAMHYTGQLVGASVGSAGSNYALRPWDWRVSEAMIKAGNEEGFGYHRMECDAQRLFFMPQAEGRENFFWMGRPYFYTAHYAYMKYHTMLLTIETGWAEESVAAMKGLFRLGNSTKESAYPVDVIKSNMNVMLCAYGNTPEEKRRSRKELWEKEALFAIGILYPETDCRVMAIFITDPKASETLLRNGRDSGRWGSIHTDRFIENIKDIKYIAAKGIADFISSGPQKEILIEKALSPTNVQSPICNGISFMLRIPYKDPQITDLRLNGYVVSESMLEKYYENGYTNIMINVSPEKIAGKDMFIISCSYSPATPRKYGWVVPPEVKERLSIKKAADTSQK